MYSMNNENTIIKPTSSSSSSNAKPSELAISAVRDYAFHEQSNDSRWQTSTPDEYEQWERSRSRRTGWSSGEASYSPRLLEESVVASGFVHDDIDLGEDV